MKYDVGDLVEIIKSLCSDPKDHTEVFGIEHLIGSLGIVTQKNESKKVYHLFVDETEQNITVYEEDLEKAK